jgi:FMN phosphatase YigB (HAD superfamily)
MLDAILFDLDGTLLPMETKEFVEGYFPILAKKAAPLGFEAKKLYDMLWRGVEGMVKNDGHETNEAAFWRLFAELYGAARPEDEAMFNDFYSHEFDGAKRFTQPNPYAREAVQLAREKAGRVILATNPVFPPCAVRTRLSWVDLSPEDFDFVTTFDNSGFCKPNPDYYRAILSRFSLDAGRCMMIGNDIGEDMVPTKEVGLSQFLVTDCVIRRGLPYDGPQGSFSELLAHLKSL